MRTLCLAILLVSSLGQLASAQQILKGVQLSSCNDKACTRLQSEEVHRATFSPNIMAFGKAKLELFANGESKIALQTFEAGDGYYDLGAQVIVLRELKNSVHRELIYNIAENRFIYF